jgi:hypothetical protein
MIPNKKSARQHVVSIRLTDKELEKALKKAEKNRLSISKYVYNAFLKGMIGVSDVRLS